MSDPAVEKAAADKAAAEKAAAEAKFAAKVVADSVKREADERANIKSHLNEVLLLRGLARSFSPHGAEDLAGALDTIANAIVSGKKLSENVLIELAIALRNSPAHWSEMVKHINDIMRPELLADRTPAGILRAVQNGDVTIEQGQDLLHKAKG